MGNNQMVEMLEERRMLSAAPSAYQDRFGVVAVQGTNAGETFFIQESSPHVVDVIITDSSLGTTLFAQEFTCVSGVSVDAKGGDDDITFAGQTVVSVINAGDGNDSIRVFDSGCFGSIVRGGSGNDSIFVDNSHQIGFDDNTATPILAAGSAVTLVDGGSGNDGINILNGSSAIVLAGSGNDGIFVQGIDATQKAHAFVDGGSGTDALTKVFADVIYIRIESVV